MSDIDMSKHTKGPWVWINSNMSEMRAGRLFGESELVLDADPGIFVRSIDDAKLIAAAPELLEALEDVTRILEAMRYTAGLGKNQLQRLEQARAAIAKAKS